MKKTLAVPPAAVVMVVSLLGAATPAQAIDDYDAQWSAIQKAGPDTYRVCLSGLELFDASQTIEMYWDAEGEGGGRRVNDVSFDGDTACGTFTETLDVGGFVYAASPGTDIYYTAVAYLSTVSVLDPACGPELTVELDMKKPVPTGAGAVYLNGELFDTWSAAEGVTTVTYYMDGLNVPTVGSYTLEWVAAAPAPYENTVLGSATIDAQCASVGSPTPSPTPAPPPSARPEPKSLIVKVKTPKQAKIKVNVDPDLSGKKSWKVQVLKKKKGTFVKVRTVRTKGPREVMTVDVPRGRYKVHVPAQRGYKAVTSKVVRVRR